MDRTLIQQHPMLGNPGRGLEEVVVIELPFFRQLDSRP
jgi:hypothetical protein